MTKVSGVTPAQQPQAAQNAQVHVVQSGDTLSAIARRYGVTLAQILEANPQFRANPDLISPGQEVWISGEAPMVQDQAARRPVGQQPVQDPAAHRPVGQQPADTIDNGTKPTAPAAGSTVEQRVVELERQLAAERQVRLEREQKEADEAKKPGFMRTVLEIFEFFGRWFTPFFNLISAVFRVLKVGYKLLTGQDIDWKKEGIRFAGDIAGCFFPPAGAVVNTGMNLWFNESQLFGGVNELFDKAPKESGLRHAVDAATGAVKRAYEGAKGLVTGGDKADDGAKPITPRQAPIA